MKEDFYESPSLPYLPSVSKADGWDEFQDDAPVEVEVMNDSRNKLQAVPASLMLECEHILRSGVASEYSIQQTLGMLGRFAAETVRIPLGFTAGELADLVSCCDGIGRSQLGFYYESQLGRECKFLVPQRVASCDPMAFNRVWTTWLINRFLFRCPVIGAVLAIKKWQFGLTYGA